MNDFTIKIEPWVTEDIELDPDTHAQLEKLAQEKNRTTNELIHEILEYKLASPIDVSHLHLITDNIDKTYILHRSGTPIALIKPIRCC